MLNSRDILAQRHSAAMSIASSKDSKRKQVVIQKVRNLTNISQTRKVNSQFLSSDGRYSNVVRISDEKLAKVVGNDSEVDGDNDLVENGEEDPAGGDRKDILVSVESSGGDEAMQLPEQLRQRFSMKKDRSR